MSNCDKNTFTIRFPVKMRIVLLAFLYLMEVALFYLTTFPEYRIGALVFGLINACLCVFVTMVSFLFRIQVNGTDFFVRTRMGKKYSFNCNDIHKIACEKRYSVKYGPSFYIHLLAKKNELIVEGTMDGFQHLADYLLTQLQTGEIPDTSASSSCKTELRRYVNGEIYTKK